MTNTLTTDVKATINQINEISSEGADIVRVSCPDEPSSKALKEIIKHVDVPIVADIHFHYKRAIEAAESGASCLRINPGNIGSKDKIKEVVKAAVDNNCSIRVGVNAGSLEKDILEKYNYTLPVISEQKFREYIKETARLVGFTEQVIVASRIGNTISEESKRRCDLISTHTARRTFITIMKNKGVPDKVIMKITGHKSLSSFHP